MDSEKVRRFRQYAKVSVIFLSLGFLLGNTTTEFIYRKKLNEISLMYNSLDISSGHMSYLRAHQLVEGKIDAVQVSLMKDYEESKQEANAINLQQLSEENWPFTVDYWYIENLASDIERINNPGPCKGKIETPLGKSDDT